MDTSATRRNFVVGAMGVGMVAGGLAAASVARADEASGAAVAANGLENKYETDILIIGGGQAGFSAGLQALELGVENVMIIDKVSGEGGDFAGSSLRCGGTFLTPTEDTEEAREAFIDTLWNYGEGHTDRTLFVPVGERAYETKAWMEGMGVTYTEPSVNFADYPALLSQSMTPMDTMPLLRDTFIENGGTMLFNVKALHFNMDAHGVCGVVAKDPDGYFNIAAKKTILCSGGYTSGKRFLEEHVDDGDEIISRAPTGITGDGIYMAEEIGGCTVQACGIKSVYLIPMSPSNLETGRAGAANNYIVVNEEGKRYVDETVEHWRHGQVLLEQPNSTCAYIADNTVWESIQSLFESFEEKNIPTYHLDTLDEVAEVIGCPAETLAATVEEFNNAIVDGRTEGLSPDKTADAVPVATPPFHVLYPIKSACSLVYGGLKINANAQVLQDDGTVIDNLYAAGEVTGGFFYNGYFGGSQMTKAAIYGRIAAEQCAAELGA